MNQHHQNYYQNRHAQIQRWGDRGPDPSENHKNIGLLSNTAQYPWKSQSYSYQASIQLWAIIGTPADRLWPVYSGICILPPLIN